MSTLPVRSPFPNRVPSIRSAPARIPSSAIADTAATVVVRMQTQGNCITVFQMFVDVFYLSGKYMWHCILNGGRDVNDCFVVLSLAAIHPKQHCTHLRHNPLPFPENFPDCTRKRSFLRSRLPIFSKASHRQRQSVLSAPWLFLNTCSRCATDVELYR